MILICSGIFYFLNSSISRFFFKTWSANLNTSRFTMDRYSGELITMKSIFGIHVRQFDTEPRSLW